MEPWRYNSGGAIGGGVGDSFGAGNSWTPSSGGAFLGGGGAGFQEQFPSTGAFNSPLGQINQVTALQRENDSLRLQNQTLNSKAQSMEHALNMAEARSRQPNPEVQRRIAELQRDCQRLHEEKEGLRRQLKQRETEAEGAAAQHEQQIRTLKGYEDQLKTQIDQEKRVANDRMEQERAQHQRDLDMARKEKEQTQDDGRKRAADLEAQIAKLQLERDRDHEAMIDAQKSSRSLESLVSKANEESSRKDELIAMHEKEGRVKQERIDEALKLVASLQANIADVEASHKKGTTELDQRMRELETLRKDNAVLLENLKAEQRNTEKWTKGYSDIGSLLGASEVEIRGINLDSCVSRVVKELDIQKHEAVKLTHDLEEKKHAVEAQKLKVTQAERERDDAKDALYLKEDQITSLQEELLQSTVELRDMLAKNDHLARDVALEAQRRGDYETALAAKEKEISELLEESSKRQHEFQKAQAEWLTEKVSLEDTQRHRLAAAESNHANAIASLEQSLALAGEEAQAQLEFTDMCTTMAELLEVNSKTSSAILARTLYEKVTEILNNEASLKSKVLKLEEELDDTSHQLKEARNHTVYVHEQPALPQLAHDSIHHHHHEDRDSHFRHSHRDPLHRTGRSAYRSDDSVASLRYRSASPRRDDERSLLRSGSGRSNGVAESRLREEAKVLRSKMAGVQIRHDDFVSAIAKALGIKHGLGERTSTDLLVERVRELMAEGKDGGDSKKYGRVGSGKHDAGSSNIKHLQRKFRIAIRTIETLDKVIDQLKQDGGSTIASSALLHQNHELQIELAELKNQLFSTGRVGVDVGTSNDFNSGDKPSYELDRYRKFVDDVCKEIGLRIMVKPDFQLILKKIREFRSTTARPQSSARPPTSARPPQSPSTRRTVTNRHIRAPFRP